VSKQAFVKQFLNDLNELLPGTPCIAVYRAYFDSLNDASFKRLIERLEAGFVLPLIVPNLKEPAISVERNLALGERWGHEFFQQLRLTDQATGKEFITPLKYLVIEWPMRRQAQTLDKKSSIPLDNSQVDDLTDQMTGDSKGSRISLPELQVLNSEGLNATIAEMIKIRGGDPIALSVLERTIIEQGSVTLEQLTSLGTRPTATNTASALLKAMHIGNNL
jgi:hypothetical protein